MDALIFSPEDVGQDASLIRHYAGLARLAVVTEARNGCTVWHGGRQVRYPPFEAQEVDPTGAGDVFAAAFFLRYTETRDVDAPRATPTAPPRSPSRAGGRPPCRTGPPSSTGYGRAGC